jgi:uncharacterized protein (DUF4415 family)
MVNDNTTTRFSVAELRKKSRSESRTDMARLRRMTEAELEERIASDPDWSEVPRDWYLKAEAAMPMRKKLVSVRLDADVLEWFRNQGAGYQTRMNAVLRSFMDEERRRAEDRRTHR